MGAGLTPLAKIVVRLMRELDFLHGRQRDEVGPDLIVRRAQQSKDPVDLVDLCLALIHHNEVKGSRFRVEGVYWLMNLWVNGINGLRV